VPGARFVRSDELRAARSSALTNLLHSPRPPATGTRTNLLSAAGHATMNACLARSLIMYVVDDVVTVDRVDRLPPRYKRPPVLPARGDCCGLRAPITRRSATPRTAWLRSLLCFLAPVKPQPCPPPAPGNGATSWPSTSLQAPLVCLRFGQADQGKHHRARHCPSRRPQHPHRRPPSAGPGRLRTLCHVGTSLIGDVWRSSN
jgi:hypothetical protein